MDAQVEGRQLWDTVKCREYTNAQLGHCYKCRKVMSRNFCTVVYLGGHEEEVRRKKNTASAETCHECHVHTVQFV